MSDILPPKLAAAFERLYSVKADWNERRIAFAEIEDIGVDSLGSLSSSLEEYWTTIVLPDGWHSKTKVIRPKPSSHGSQHPRPLIVMYHGGGFSIGSPQSITRPGREFAERFGAVVVCPSYKLTHEGRWPAPMTTAWDVLAYLSENPAEFGATLDGINGGFYIVGFSAGAGLSAVCAGLHVFGGNQLGGRKQLAKPLTGVFLNTPLFLTKEIVPTEFAQLWTSREDNRHTEGLNTEGVEAIWDNLQPDVSSPWFSPINTISQAQNRKELAAECPPFYIQTARLDPLRDDGIVLARMLSDLGCTVKEDCFKDDGHIGWTAVPVSPKTPGVAQATMDGMKWLFDQRHLQHES
ncbi:hypothetical protein O1611_g89 [Lasiodiplodia mahajangana]|uniref:Uncharacterized protein n=1 Tax=Lasiodiplodia mahajangana TaxID=1108764 RepID=A0ACC2K181_9PEZI|nr:hypothetical protein O1611_g89 [Lasiodiplodia mahajangana]